MADRAAAGGHDLPAALTRAGWAGRYPSPGYLFAWYGGLYPAGYSLLAPYLLAGVRHASVDGGRDRALRIPDGVVAGPAPGTEGTGGRGLGGGRAVHRADRAKTAAVVMLALLTSMLSRWPGCTWALLPRSH